MKIEEQKLEAAMNSAYKEAGHHAYFNNGFRMGVEFALSEIETHQNKQDKEPNKLKKGELVVMHTCGESSLYKGKIWVCKDDSYEMSNGHEVVFLIGFSGCFATEYLQIVDLNHKS